ncbi:MAG: hypothetical protein AAB799_01065 [Patescibacteria group bacterium]
MTKILDLRKKVKLTKTEPKVLKTYARLESAVPQNEVPELERPGICWEAPSFHYNPQKRYLSVTIVALLAGAAAILLLRSDTLTSIFLILASLVLVLYSNQKPVTSKIVVNQAGILVDDKMYHYRELKSFWIEYSPGGNKELSIESAKWYVPYTKILLNNQNPVELRSLIINFLPEREHENSLVDVVGRKLGL